VLSKRNNYIQAVYIEKLTYLEKVIDPFGGTTEFERVSYQQIEFQLSTFQPNVLIFQPPRNYRKLINQLAQFVDYEIAIETKEVKVFDWIDSIMDIGMTGVVTKVNVDPVNYDKSTVGKLILTGHYDIRERVYQLLAGTSFFVKNAKITFSENMHLPDVEIYSNGKIIFKHPVSIESFKNLYDAFCSLIEDQNAEQIA